MSQNQKPYIVRALEREREERVPIWFMRQAGRYLPEYNEIRKGLTFIQLTQNPELACEVSLQPWRRLGVDGIIMFADILTPLHGAGVPLHFEEKKGPVLERVIESESDLSLLDQFDPHRDTPYVKELLHRIADGIEKERGDSVPPTILGFAGAPFTLASYLIEGGTSRKFEKTKEFLFGRTELYHKIANRLVEMTIDYLLMQVENGARVVQIFDSWGGILSSAHYSEFAAPYTARIIDAVKSRSDSAVTLFVGNSAHLLPEMVAQKPSILSLDWRIRSAQALEEIPETIALQGNMDPLLLYGDVERVNGEVSRILNELSVRPNYIFNLGHGIHPGSRMECVEAMVQGVQSFRRSI